VILDVVLAAAAILAIYLWSRRDRITHRTFHQPEPGQFVRPKQKKAKKSDQSEPDQSKDGRA